MFGIRAVTFGDTGFDLPGELQYVSRTELANAIGSYNFLGDMRCLKCNIKKGSDNKGHSSIVLSKTA